MLEKLNTINWSELQACYDPGEKIPVLIHALTSEDEQVHTEAIEQLDANLWHQGDVYSATLYAIPFLIELLEVNTVKKKKEILNLLSACANSGPIDLDLYYKIEHEIQKGKMVYHKFLDDPDPAIRSDALGLYLIAEEEISRAAYEMQQRLVREEDHELKKYVAVYLGDAIAKGQLSIDEVKHYRDVLREHANTEQNLYVSAGIHLGLIRLPNQQIDEEALGNLFCQVRQLEDALHPRIEKLLIRICIILDRIDNPRKVQYLVRLLENVRLEGCVRIAIENLLNKVYEAGNQLNLMNLTQEQKLVIGTIVANDSIWSSSDIVEYISRFGLPGDRRLLAQTISIDPPSEWQPPHY